MLKICLVFSKSEPHYAYKRKKLVFTLEAKVILEAQETALLNILILFLKKFNL